MCHGTTFKRWQADTILNLLAIEGVKPKLLIIENKKSKIKALLDIFKIIKFSNILWFLWCYSWPIKSKALKSINLSKELRDVQKIKCTVIEKGKFSQYFNETDIQDIKNAELDFILRFGFGIIRGEILNAAKFGVWSFHHNDEEKYRGGPPCFWEIYNNDNVTGSILQKLTNKLDAGIILKKGFLKTKLNYSKNRDQLFLESSKWPAQLCVDIFNENTTIFYKEPSSTNSPIYYSPSNGQFIYYILKTFFLNLKSFYKMLLYTDFWDIGIVKAPISAFLNEEKPAVEWFPLKGKSKFIADPFVLIDKQDVSKLHIFYESYPFKKNKGIIDYFCYQNGKYSESTTVIDEKYHLAYPFSFQLKEQKYIIPEGCNAKNISLYKSVEFPYKWEKEQILIENFAGVDSTLFYYNETYWLFTSDKNNGVRFNLNIFYSDNLKSNWVAHPKNPVKTDIRSSRCAGTPFTYLNEIYRPSMDYSEKIEGRIIINKIFKLSKTEFEEIAVKTIDPYTNSYYSDKIHTLCEAGEFTVIDGCKEICVLTNWKLFKSQLLLIFNTIFS